MKHGGPVNAHKQEAMSPCPKPRVRGYEKGGGVTLSRSETTTIPDHEGPRKDSDYYDYLSSAERAGSAVAGAVGGIGAGLGKRVLPEKKPKRKTDKERLLEKMRKTAKRAAASRVRKKAKE